MSVAQIEVAEVAAGEDELRRDAGRARSARIALWPLLIPLHGDLIPAARPGAHQPQITSVLLVAAVEDAGRIGDRHACHHTLSLTLRPPVPKECASFPCVASGLPPVPSLPIVQAMSGTVSTK